MRIRVTTRPTCLRNENRSTCLIVSWVDRSTKTSPSIMGKSNSILQGQLADIGVTPEDITCLALSHSHFDHVGNANDFAGSIWLAQKAECDLRFETHAITQGARSLPPWRTRGCK